METQIQVKIDSEEKSRIVKASKKLAIGHSTFMRMASLEKANDILIKMGEEK